MTFTFFAILEFTHIWFRCGSVELPLGSNFRGGRIGSGGCYRGGNSSDKSFPISRYQDDNC